MDASPLLAALPLKADLSSTASSNKNARIKVRLSVVDMCAWVDFTHTYERDGPSIHQFTRSSIPTNQQRRQVFVKGSEGFAASLSLLFTAANPGAHTKAHAHTTSRCFVTAPFPPQKMDMGWHTAQSPTQHTHTHSLTPQHST